MTTVRGLVSQMPIARKVACMIAGATALSLLLMSLALVGYELVNSPRAIRSEVETIADVIGASTKGALLFGDSERATETLRALHAKSCVVRAAIYDHSGVFFAGFARAAPTPSRSSHLLAWGSLWVERPILVDGQRVGAIRILATLDELYGRLRRYLTMVATILAILLVLVVVVTARLIRAFTHPLRSLAEAARAISNRDYSVRAIKRTDDEIGELSDAFNKMVEEVSARTESLMNANRELMEARQKADAAANTKAQFLANMSHEIRTPMNGILGMTELALDTAATPEQRDQLSTVYRSAQSLLTLLDDILTLSKIEAGKVELEKTLFDVQDVMDDVHRLLALSAHQKNIELFWDADPRIPSVVLGDPARIRQVLTNLAGNAIKFTNSGEVFTQAELVSSNGYGLVISFTVTDTGIGLDPDQQEKIFAPFVQADESITRKHGGTGLGLAICRRLVELMGGTISVDSTPGEGSAFRFTVVLSEPLLRAPAGAIAAQPPIGTRIMLVGGGRPSDVVRRNLEAEGIRVDPVSDAKVALDLLVSRPDPPYSFVIADWSTPMMSGLELAVKAAREGARTILMASSLEVASGAGRSAEMAAAKILVKPISRRQLLGAIDDRIVRELRDSHESDAGGGSSARTLDILLAEDNPVNQKVVCAQLGKLNHRVTVVSNGALAFEQMQSRSFDLVLMDVQMPIMDGLSAAASIRRYEMENSLRRIPIVALTAHAMDGDAARCIASGMDEYLSKPLQSQRLREVLTTIGARTGG